MSPVTRSQLETIPDQKYTKGERYHDNSKARLRWEPTYFILRMFPWTILVQSQIMILSIHLIIWLS